MHLQVLRLFDVNKTYFIHKPYTLIYENQHFLLMLVTLFKVVRPIHKKCKVAHDHC
jgi:hypothetical protein